MLDSQERAFWDVHRPMVSPIFFLSNSTKLAASRDLSDLHSTLNIADFVSLLSHRQWTSCSPLVCN